MKVVEMVDYAYKNNQIKEYLKGEGMYYIRNRYSEKSDFGAALYNGIHEYYQINSNIKDIFENTIREMLKGDELDIMVSFEYIYLQLLSEIKKNCPFYLDKECYEELKNCILNNADMLKQYKSNSDYNPADNSGAYGYIENINNYFEEEYGCKIM